MIQIGQHVHFMDESNKHRDALVTAVHSETYINIVVVSDDERGFDDYGRKLERFSSVSHKSVVPEGHGRHFYTE